MQCVKPAGSPVRLFWMWFAMAGLLLAACGQEGGKEVEPPDNGENGNETVAERRLAIVGPALIQLEAGGEATLRVALAESEYGAVAGEVVEFAIVGAAAGSTFAAGETATAVTDAQGMASVDLTAGSEQTTFQVTAASPGTQTVAFAVQVVRLQHRISIVRTPSVRVDSSGTAANVESGAFARVLLRVRITDQFGRPVPDVPVRYQFDDPAQSASFDGASPVVTNPGGEAQLALDTGEHFDDSFRISARTDESGAARWSVRVQTDESQICVEDSDCGPGLYCRSGVCTGSAACSNEEPVIECPVGYRCVVNECHPSINVSCDDDDECGTGFICVDGSCQAENPQCEEDEDCPSGFECQAGVCIGDPEGELPNVAGGWHTAHHFDIREALPDVIDTAAGPLREIHRILLGEISWPSWVPGWARDFLEDMIQATIDQYVPPEVTTVVQILDTIVTVMSDMRASGYMAVTQTGPSFYAEEVWSSFVFYYLPLCPGAPPSDPTPDCARVDLFVEDLTDHVSLGLRVYPFSGAVGEIGADGTALFLVDDRKVDINVARLIRWVVDELVDILTPHDDLESAVLASVDCQALGQWAEGIISIPFVPPGAVGDLVEGACNMGVVVILDRVLDALTGVAFDVGLLEMSGQATVHDIRAGNHANLLGYPDYETSRDGSWDGSFTRVIGGVPGGWHGSRRALP